MLHVHRAERADTLAAALAGVLATPLADPFATEVVAVPARGIERWLAHRLSHRLGATTAGDGAGGAGGDDGVCAGVRFPSPDAVVAEAVAASTGVDARDDPWRPERSVWPLLEVVDAAAGEEWAAALTAHVGGRDANGPDGRGANGAGTNGADPGRRERRWATARRLAGLFASYAAHRPEMLLAWQAGTDAEVGGPLTADLAWQPELWRRLRARIGVPGPAERLAAAAEVLRERPEVTDLPPRLSVFGATRLSAAQLVVLSALAEHRELHLWVPHPSPALWARDPFPAGGRSAGVPRRSAIVGRGAKHPLLASQGRDVRELQLGLIARAPGFADVHHPAPEPPATLLGRLQTALRDDEPPLLGPVQGADDRSVQVHACHGAHRQVEVLREVVLGLLAQDPTLEPRDVLVMCPDIETFAPLISAAFGLGSDDEPGGAPGGADRHPAHTLRVRLADRALRQVNPLLDTVSQLVELAGSRLTASEVLDLLASPPVARRFRLDEDDVARVRELVAAAGIRWGLDAEHRAAFQLGGFGQNTWQAGLDRLLLGVAMPGDGRHWLDTALPLGQVESSDVDRVGKLTEFVDRLTGVLARLQQPQPLAAWTDALVAGLDALTDTAVADEWQGAQARGELAEAVAVAGPHAAAVPLGPAEVAGLLAERLRGRPSRSNFRTGTLTVATLVPMRSVPHRVVCLLGLDEGSFPRAGVPDGDDVLARDPVVGERDPRSEDRQLLLDAVCAATEHLVVVHSGFNERTGVARPPAVPLGELLDTVESTVGPEGRDRVVVKHPLQPFDARNFVPGELGSARPFSFDRAELAGALAAAAPGPRAAAPPFLVGLLPAEEDRPVDLDELVSFLEHPVKGFLRGRVKLSVGERDEDAADALPVALDGLQIWHIGDRVLRDRLAGHDRHHCRQAEWRRGDLPPGPLGERILSEVLTEVEPLVEAAERLGAVADRGSRDVDVTLPGGTRVTGTVTGVAAGRAGSTLAAVEYAKLAPKQRIRAWVRLLAVTASTGERWRAVTVGRGAEFGIARAQLSDVTPEQATAILDGLVDVYRQGQREPLPLALRTALTYAQTRRKADAGVALTRALATWSGRGLSERREHAHAVVWGSDAPDHVLTDQPGPPGGEPTRFGELALRLWRPVLDVETVELP